MLVGGVVPEGVVVGGLVVGEVVLGGAVGVASQRCDTLKKNGVTFMSVLSMTVNGSLPSVVKFAIIRWTASFPMMRWKPEGGVAKRVRLATWKVTNMWVPFSPITWEEKVMPLIIHTLMVYYPMQWSGASNTAMDDAW